MTLILTLFTLADILAVVRWRARGGKGRNDHEWRDGPGHRRNGLSGPLVHPAAARTRVRRPHHGPRPVGRGGAAVPGEPGRRSGTAPGLPGRPAPRRRMEAGRGLVRIRAARGVAVPAGPAQGPRRADRPGP